MSKPFRRKGSKNWYVTVTVKGKTVTKSAHTEDRKEAKAYQETLRKKLYAEEMLGDLPEILLHELLYKELATIKGKPNYPNVATYFHKATTGKKGNPNAPGEFTTCATLGDEKTMLHELTTEMIVDFINNRREEEVDNRPGKKLSDRTIALEISSVRSVIRKYEHKFKTNPLIKWPGKYGPVKLEKGKKLDRTLSISQINALYDDLRKNIDNHVDAQGKITSVYHYKQAVDQYHLTAFYCNTACRAGEICHLQWFPTEKPEEESYIDFDNRQLKIYRPKTKTRTDLGIPKKLWAIILERKAAARAGQKWVFESPIHEGQPRAINANEGIRKSLRRVCGAQPFRIHDFRHHASSILLNRGATMPEIAWQLGHGGDGSTTSLYPTIDRIAARKKMVAIFDAYEEECLAARKSNIKAAPSAKDDGEAA